MYRPTDESLSCTNIRLVHDPVLSGPAGVLERPRLPSLRAGRLVVCEGDRREPLLG